MAVAPDRGDLVWLQFTPQAGHEQAGRRPALVISPRAYNEKVGLALFCPITNRVKGYPFEVALPPGLRITGVVLSDQIRSLDWPARRAEPVEGAPDEVVGEVLAKVAALLGFAGPFFVRAILDGLGNPSYSVGQHGGRGRRAACSTGKGGPRCSTPICTSTRSSLGRPAATAT